MKELLRSCRRVVLTLLLVLLAARDARAYEKLRTIYSWKSLDFAYPNDYERQLAVSSGDFVPGGPLPIDVDVYAGGKTQQSRVFVSVPRFQAGVPVTLGYVSDQVAADGSPLIAPYPNWEFNKPINCDRVTSVYRMKIDECNRLWVLDTGNLMFKQVCPAQLHVFDLNTNHLIAQYKFPRSMLKEDSLFVTIAVDVRGTEDRCEDTFAYIADVTGFQLIVYDHRNRRSWRITNNLFYPYPPDGTFEIRGESFDLMDGILGLALSPIRGDGDRILYFHSLASKVESYVRTSVIRNFTLFNETPDAAAREFVPFRKTRSSQSVAQAMDTNGVLFFGLTTDVAIGCWNSVRYPEYGGLNNEIVVVNPETLQFPSGIKVITGKNGRQELWVLTPSFQKYMTGSLNPKETNFRIQAGYVDELVRGTKCGSNGFVSSLLPGISSGLSGSRYVSSASSDSRATVTV